MRCDAIAIGALYLSGVGAYAQEAEPDAEPNPVLTEDVLPDPVNADDGVRVVHFGAIWENDGAYVKPINNSDRHYTNGLEFDWSLRGGWIEDWARNMPGDAMFDSARYAGGIVAGQLMFTGRDIELDNPPPGDRPYAGYAYLGLYLQRSDRYKMDHAELQLGLVGEWSGAQAVQEFVHAAVPSQVMPEGWDTQLPNEPTVNVNLVRRYRSDPIQLGALSADIIPEVGVQLGTVRTSLDGAFTVRLGYNLPDNFGATNRISGFRDATGSWGAGSNGDDWGVFGYARFGAALKAHDIFLDGTVFKDSRSVDSNELVGDLQLGVAARVGKLEFGYAVTFMTEEFDGQPGDDDFGSIYLSYTFEF